jgi:molecular chaperone Hsp33
MTNKDSLMRFIFENAPIRGELIHLENSFQTIIHQHQYPQSLHQFLGEALSVAGMLSAIIKFSGRLTVQFRGKGKLKLMLAQCDNEFHLRGLAKWEGHLSYDALMASFDEGILVIMIDSGQQGKPYQGIVSWRDRSLVKSVEGYFRESEQLATRIWLSVDDKRAAGLLLQVIPGTKTELKDQFEDETVYRNWDHIVKLTESLDVNDLLNLDNQQLLTKLYPDEEVRIFGSKPVSFQCQCSRKRGEDAIQLLGREEAEAELKDHHSIVVTCDFCNKEYFFDRVDVAKIFENKDKVPPDQQLH